MWRATHMFLVCLMASTFICSMALAKNSRKENYHKIYTLFDDLTCAPTHHATGCTAPYPKCVPGFPYKDAVKYCKIEAREQKCPDFSWEKCCATNCFLLNSQSFGPPMNRCLERCGSVPEARFYFPNTNKE